MTSGSRDEAPDGTPVGFVWHDHGACVATALSAAEARCGEEGLRFTPVRRAALTILLQEHRALGAYAILERLKQEGFGSQPPVAYRALEFLVAHGMAHRIERLNAFVACDRPGEAHSPAFMICRLCEAVAETPSAPGAGALDAAARAAGFRIERAVVEAEGVCPGCAGDAAA